MEGKFELQFEDNEYYLVDGKTNDTIATTDKVLLKEYDGYMKKLSLKNCEAIERGYDVFELAYDSSKEFLIESTHSPSFTFGYEQGFQKALKILGDKKFSEDDLRLAMHFGKFGEANSQTTTIGFIKSLQQTEWDVEICCYLGNGDKESDSFKDTFVTNTGIPKLDSDGCLILRRI